MPNASKLLRSYPLVPLVIVLTIVACDQPKPKPNPVTDDRQRVLLKLITPGPVKFAPVPLPNGGQTRNPKKIQGSFRISNSADKEAIPSYGTGGACLIADLNPSLPKMSTPNRKCSENSECQRGLPLGWVGYCADQDEGSAENICWVRPGPDVLLCDKSAFYDPPKVWSLDVDHPSNPVFDISGQNYPGTGAISSPSRSFTDMFPGPVGWRVVACLNGTDLPPGCGDPHAKPPQRREVFGPITITPPIPRPHVPMKIPPQELPHGPGPVETPPDPGSAPHQP